MPRQLKVFRTPIGFHDAYVAAPSQKAALAAWGAEADLFARGVAEQVTDPALIEEPLAHPGEVIRRTRGTLDQHIAALPAAKTSAAKPRRAEAAPAPAKSAPRPSRVDLDAAEQAVEDVQRRYEEAKRDLAAREAALARERRALDRDHDRERTTAEGARDREDARYRRAMTRWRDGRG